jgi:GTP-binding protein
VGIPNVGKSTLFNRLVGRRRALVGSTPGLTRDRIHATVRIGDRTLILVDTGGIFPERGDGLEGLVRDQARLAIEQADLVLFLTSAREGPVPAEEELAARLRRSGRPVLLVANKVDHPGLQAALADLYRLGLGDPIPIAAEHGAGIPELTRALLERLPEIPPLEEEDGEVRSLAIVGRPNVGKSSLLNALVQEERAIVNDRPGTTRDAVDLDLAAGGHTYRVIDTAGIRRGSRRDAMEGLSILQATRSLAGAAVALLVVDGGEGLTSQDLAVAGLAHEHHRPFLLLVNKWDLRAGDPGARDAFREEVRRRLRFARYAPVLFLSARTRQGLAKIFPTIERVWQNGATRIGTGRLNRLVKEAAAQHTGRARDGSPMRILYVAQTGTHPPRFVVFTSSRKAPHFSFRRFLENRIRKEFGLDLTPVVLEWRSR